MAWQMRCTTRLIRPTRTGSTGRECRSTATSFVLVKTTNSTRKLISDNVEADERAHAYLGIPLGLKSRAPGIVALHGTTPQGKELSVTSSARPRKR